MKGISQGQVAHPLSIPFLKYNIKKLSATHSFPFFNCLDLDERITLQSVLFNYFTFKIFSFFFHQIEISTYSLIQHTYHNTISGWRGCVRPITGVTILGGGRYACTHYRQFVKTKMTPVYIIFKNSSEVLLTFFGENGLHYGIPITHITVLLPKWSRVGQK